MFFTLSNLHFIQQILNLPIILIPIRKLPNILIWRPSLINIIHPIFTIQILNNIFNTLRFLKWITLSKLSISLFLIKFQIATFICNFLHFAQWLDIWSFLYPMHHFFWNVILLYFGANWSCLLIVKLNLPILLLFLLFSFLIHRVTINGEVLIKEAVQRCLLVFSAAFSLVSHCSLVPVMNFFSIAALRVRDWR